MRSAVAVPFLLAVAGALAYLHQIAGLFVFNRAFQPLPTAGVHQFVVPLPLVTPNTISILQWLPFVCRRRRPTDRGPAVRTRPAADRARRRIAPGRSPFPHGNGCRNSAPGALGAAS